MSSKIMFTELSKTKIESEVQMIFENGFKKKYPNSKIEHNLDGIKTDGYFEIKLSDGKVRYALTEYKYDKNMSDWYERSEVISQTIYYINNLLRIGKPCPDVVFIADKDEWLVLDVRKLEKFFTRTDINWDIAPSSAPGNTAFCMEISEDEYIRSIDVHDIDSNFNFDDIIKEITDICENIIPYKYTVDARSIDEAYCRFKNCINKHIKTKELVKLFVKTLIEPKNYHQDEIQKARLVTENGDMIPIHRLAFSAFHERYVKEYTDDEKKTLTEIADRIIEEEDRRTSGDFWTPTKFVTHANELIGNVFGDNWRNEYTVWDCCCGTKNLTRDDTFKELYCSTLFQSELDMGVKYNSEATTFQFDFLNDDFEKLPDGLKTALREKRKILIDMNPPFARNGGNAKGFAGSKSSAFTKINEMMKNEKVGSCSANMFAQFLFRILKWRELYDANISLGLFCKPIFLSGESYAKFRDRFLSMFKYEGGFLFNAGHFSDVSQDWGINFTCWTPGETIDKNNFEHTLVDVDHEGNIVEIGKKVIYNTDGNTRMSDWLEVDVKMSGVTPCMKSAINVSQKSKGTTSGVLGWLTNGNNNVCNNSQEVYIMACPNDRGKTNTPIMESNFLKTCSAFASRKLIHSDWKNCLDEYFSPEENNPNYHGFEMDSVIYSLFSTHSQQSSLRDVEFGDKMVNIPNHFFWMSRKEIVNLTKDYDNEDVYNDAVNSKDRFVYEFIKKHISEFSVEARTVLDKASELVRKSFKRRWLFNQDYPQYQINNWDCGYYQIKAMIGSDIDAKKDKELIALVKEFNELYNILSEKLRPMVYELGFLKK